MQKYASSLLVLGLGTQAVLGFGAAPRRRLIGKADVPRHEAVHPLRFEDTVECSVLMHPSMVLGTAREVRNFVRL